MDITDLPVDVIFDILSFLPPEDLLNIRLVCRQWLQLTESATFWSKVNLNFRSRNDNLNLFRCLKLAPALHGLRLHFHNFNAARKFTLLLLNGGLNRIRSLSISGKILKNDIESILNRFGPNLVKLQILQCFIIWNESFQLCSDMRVYYTYLENQMTALAPIVGSFPLLEYLKTDLPSFQTGPFKLGSVDWPSLRRLDISRLTWYKYTRSIMESHELLSRTKNQLDSVILPHPKGGKTGPHNVEDIPNALRYCQGIKSVSFRYGCGLFSWSSKNFECLEVRAGVNLQSFGIVVPCPKQCFFSKGYCLLDFVNNLTVFSNKGNQHCTLAIAEACSNIQTLCIIENYCSSEDHYSDSEIAGGVIAEILLQKLKHLKRITIRGCPKFAFHSDNLSLRFPQLKFESFVVRNDIMLNSGVPKVLGMFKKSADCKEDLFEKRKEFQRKSGMFISRPLTKTM